MLTCCVVNERKKINKLSRSFLDLFPFFHHQQAHYCPSFFGVIFGVSALKHCGILYSTVNFHKVPFNISEDFPDNQSVYVWLKNDIVAKHFYMYM